MVVVVCPGSLAESVRAHRPEPRVRSACFMTQATTSTTATPDVAVSAMVQPNRPAKSKKQEIVNSKNFHFVSN